jgi:hypothetical protein
MVSIKTVERIVLENETKRNLDIILREYKVPGRSKLFHKDSKVMGILVWEFIKWPRSVNDWCFYLYDIDNGNLVQYNKHFEKIIQKVIEAFVVQTAKFQNLAVFRRKVDCHNPPRKIFYEFELEEFLMERIDAGIDNLISFAN